jgi:predicted nucleic acid-binding Zn ribbon protein
MRRSGHVTSLGVALEDLLARREARARVKERLSALVWRDCVGTFYAARTLVTRVERGVMHVWCNSPALAHQLSLDAEEIIRRVNAELAGEYIKEIRPTSTGRRRTMAAADVGPLRSRGPTRKELEAIRVSPRDRQAIEAEAAQIEDEALRERFRSTALAQRRTQKWRRQHGYTACRHCGWLVPPPLRHCSKCGRTL